METIIVQNEDSLTARFTGRLDTSASIQVEKDIQPLFLCQGQDIVLDCEHLEYISSSGLRLFLNLLKVSTPKGVRIIISGANNDLRKVFLMTGFHRLFKFV